MAIGQPTPDTHIEVIATSRPQSRFNCCVNRQRLHSIITGMTTKVQEAYNKIWKHTILHKPIDIQTNTPYHLLQHKAL